jgi:hypothetical protein
MSGESEEKGGGQGLSPYNTDPKTIVVKFRRGLNPSIADAVATMASGRPDDLDLEAWFEAAIRFDQNQAANAAF